MFPDHCAALNAGVELLRECRRRVLDDPAASDADLLEAERNRLRAIIDQADRELAEGRCITLNEAGLREFFDDVIRRGRERLASRAAS